MCVFAPISIHLSRTILLAIFATMIGFFGFSEAATADIVADRKAGFKANATSMKAIAAAIGSGNYLTVINQAETISRWAQKIPSYFPEGSGLAILGRGPKYGSALKILLYLQRPMKPLQTS